MCLSPIKIKSRSKYFVTDKLQSYYVTIPCGVCVECQAAKSNEYYFRTYYQCLDCWKQGGYVLFDTLTYDDDHLPHISDFYDEFDYPLEFPSDMDYSCFDYTDIRLFTVNLRRQLEYHGFSPKSNLKYFICSEYGHEDEYIDMKGHKRVGTRRPHYHIMLFVYEPGKLSPMELSEYVAKCWKHGRTDGYGYQTPAYIMNHVFMSCDELHARSMCNYVGKYMVKDDEWYDEIYRRFKDLENCIRATQVKYLVDYYSGSEDGIDILEYFKENLSSGVSDIFQYGFWKKNADKVSECIELFGDEKFEQFKRFVLRSNEETKDVIRKVKRHVMPFTRQSQGYGLYMIDYLSPEWIFENNCVRMPDKDSVWKDIPIPTYISNKMFKEKVVDEYGNEIFQWSEYGNEYRKYHSIDMLKKSVDKLSQRVSVTNLVSAGLDIETAKRLNENFYMLLDGRPLIEYFYYKKFWQYRLFDFTPYFDENGELHLDNLFSLDGDSFDTLWEIYSSDKHIYDEFGNGDSYFDDGVYHVEDDVSMQYVEHYIIDSSTDYRFRYFDAMDDLIMKINKIYGEHRQAVYCRKRDLEKRLMK